MSLIKVSDFLAQNTNLGGEHRGKVVEWNDPDKKGKVKVTIPGLLEGDTDKLPWVYPKVNSSVGGSAETGSLHVPEMGSDIIVTFPHGNIYHPVYSGYWPSDSNSDVSDLLTNYPNTVGHKDAAGNVLKIDKQAGTLEYSHTAGREDKTTKINFKLLADGSLEVTAQGKIKLTATGDVEVTTQGKASIVATGDVKVQSSGNVQITGQNVSIN